jgi:predicted tellurium resistance membrane protein TerC
MFETFFLFLALFVLEVILEIDNITALRQAASRLPNTPLCRGQVPHGLALFVRVGLAFLLFHTVGYFKHISLTTGSGVFEQVGGALLIMVAVGLIINYFHGGRNLHAASVRQRASQKRTTLGAFLIADAFLSLDTVIAAVAMTSSFGLAVTAMISAAVCIMLFHEPLHAWLKVNPRAALLAFVIIGLLGFNLILSSQGVHIPKYALLFFVVIGVCFDRIDKDNKRRAAECLAKSRTRQSGTPSQKRGSKSHLATTIDTAIIPGIVDVAWQEITQKSADLRATVEAEKVKRDGACYIFGTTHSAGIQPGLYGFIFQGAMDNPLCNACGVVQPSTFSLCDRCGHYRFLCPAGIFEVGSLKLLTMRR